MSNQYLLELLATRQKQCRRLRRLASAIAARLEVSEGAQLVPLLPAHPDTHDNASAIYHWLTHQGLGGDEYELEGVQIDQLTLELAKYLSDATRYE